MCVTHSVGRGAWGVGRAMIWRMMPHALTGIKSETCLSRYKIPSQTVNIHRMISVVSSSSID